MIYFCLTNVSFFFWSESQPNKYYISASQLHPLIVSLTVTQVSFFREVHKVLTELYYFSKLWLHGLFNPWINKLSFAARTTSDEEILDKTINHNFGILSQVKSSRSKFIKSLLVSNSRRFRWLMEHRSYNSLIGLYASINVSMKYKAVICSNICCLYLVNSLATVQQYQCVSLTVALRAPLLYFK